MDHIIPYRYLRQFLIESDPNDLRNLVSMCRKCHQIKGVRAESKLTRGDKEEFVRELRLMITEEKIKECLEAYNLIGNYNAPRV